MKIKHVRKYKDFKTKHVFFYILSTFYLLKRRILLWENQPPVRPCNYTREELWTDVSTQTTMRDNVALTLLKTFNLGGQLIFNQHTRICLSKYLTEGTAAVRAPAFTISFRLRYKYFWLLQFFFFYLFIGDRLKNFDVMVASDVIDPTQSSDKQLCAHVEGPVPRGGWIEIKCDPPIRGR